MAHKEQEHKKNKAVQVDPTGGQRPNNNNNNKKRKKLNEAAVFGNYRNYYSYRIDQELEEDPRMKILKKEWFEGKDCLDIGCNSGLITITIAKKLSCHSILGIDIDSARVQDAYWNLRKKVRASTSKVPPKASQSENAGLNGAEDGITEPRSEVTHEIAEDSCASLLFDKVSFRKENFVQDWPSPEAKLYDTIVCFSVTKWIHLNWGDEGLITLFAKIWRLLRPGGVLILEPQPWISYYKNRLVSEITSYNYQNIEINPQDFQEILLDKIGFRTIENIASGLSGSKAGFNRPILALWK